VDGVSLDRIEQWTAFKQKFRKTYTLEDEEMRRRIFFKRLADIELHNYQASIGEQSFTRGINEFSDMEYSEFLTKKSNCFKGRNATLPRKPFTLPDPDNLPDLPNTVDWTTKGYVTPVKNQMDCGGCYAFSSTGALEGQIKRKTGKLVSLSEQNIIDCSKTWGNHGCGGGFMDNSFQYIADNAGIDFEEAYPYQNREGTCRFSENTNAARDTGSAEVADGDERLLKWAVATYGPVAVAIDVPDSFMTYTDGVYNDTSCSQEPCHAVLVVGYGTYHGEEYWLVKNSWGEFWGLNGYIRMSRNNDNQCAIASYAIIPQM
jgi:cathepsin L